MVEGGQDRIAGEHQLAPEGRQLFPVLMAAPPAGCGGASPPEAVRHPSPFARPARGRPILGGSSLIEQKRESPSRVPAAITDPGVCLPPVLDLTAWNGRS